MTPSALIPRAAGLINTQLYDSHWCLFFTLTYRDGEEWAPKQVSRFVDNYRVWIKRNGYSDHKLAYIWTAEMHKKRNYVHYHGLIWIPKGLRPPKPDQQGWWKYGSTNVQRAYNPAVYIAKYLSKGSDGFPPKTRRYSINTGGHVRLDYLRVPGWLAYMTDMYDEVKRLSGIGWVNLTKCCAYVSPFVRIRRFFDYDYYRAGIIRGRLYNHLLSLFKSGDLATIRSWKYKRAGTVQPRWRFTLDYFPPCYA